MLKAAADAVSVIYQAEADPKQKDIDQKTKCVLGKKKTTTTTFQKNHYITLRGMISTIVSNASANRIALVLSHF